MKVVAILFAVLISLQGNAATISAALDRTSITVGESAVISLTFEGGVPQGDIEVPKVDNLIFTESGQTRQTFIFNGRRIDNYVQTYTVTPSKEGEYNIPPFIATVNGQKIASNPLKLYVGKPDPRDIERFARLRMIVNKNEVSQGEPFLVEIRLLYLTLNGGDQPQIAGDGFTIGKFVQNESSVIEDNRAWRLLTFKTFAIALKSGQLTLGPASMKVVIPARLERNFFGETVVSAWRTVVLSTPSISVTVHPLPDSNVPAEFNGAIGVFTMNISAAPTNVAVGDPITLKIAISGRGSIESLTLPEQSSFKDFKVYPPTSKVELTDQFGLTGTKTFEQVIVPQTTEIREIPPFVFAYYDTEQKQYRILSGPRIPIIVRPAASVQYVINTGTNVFDTRNQADIVHIKQRLGAVGTISEPLIARPWFIGIQTLPAALWLIALARRKHLEKLQNNPRLLRKRNADRVIEDGLTKLETLANENKSEEFFALVFRLLQERLGERLDLPSHAITEAVIDEYLRPAKVPDDLIDRLQQLFNLCNQARYAGVRTTAELTEILTKLKVTLKDLSEINLEIPKNL